MKTNSGWCSDSVWAVPSEANSLYEFMRCGQGWKCKDFPPRLLQLYRNTLFKRTFSQENFKIYKVLKLHQDAAGDSLEILLVLQSPGWEVLVPVILSDPSQGRYQTSLIVADEDALPFLTDMSWGDHSVLMVWFRKRSCFGQNPPIRPEGFYFSVSHLVLTSPESFF